MDSDLEKMLAGQPHNPASPVLSKMSQLAHRLCRDYNLLTDTDKVEREAILDKLFPDHKDGLYIQGSVNVDYGKFTHIGKEFFANFNFTVLDGGSVTIGDNVMCGPNVTLATPIHPLLPSQRNPHQQADGSQAALEYSKPITIGNNCWLASNVVVCAGVTISDNCVIGAGSVVTKDIPSDSLAVGVPAKVIRKITEEDRLDKYPY